MSVQAHVQNGQVCAQTLLLALRCDCAVPRVAAVALRGLSVSSSHAPGANVTVWLLLHVNNSQCTNEGTPPKRCVHVCLSPCALQELLALGNEVNRHRGAPPAAGFKLSSLNKFAELRSWDTQWSLLEVGAQLHGMLWSNAMLKARRSRALGYTEVTSECALARRRVINVTRSSLRPCCVVGYGAETVEETRNGRCCEWAQAGHLVFALTPWVLSPETGSAPGTSS